MKPPVAWVLVNKDGKIIEYHKPLYFDPTGGGHDCYRKDLDLYRSDEAPHRWQPLVFQ